MTMCSTSFSFPFYHIDLNRVSSIKPCRRVSAFKTRSALSDPYVLQLAETFEDSLSSTASERFSLLQKLRVSSSESILSKSWPSPKDERFRFTDISFLKQADITPVTTIPSLSPDENPPSPDFYELQSPYLLIVDGQVAPAFSNLSSLPSDIFVGSIYTAPESLFPVLSNSLAEFPDGDLFWDLNGMGTLDIAVIYVPAGTSLSEPLHLRFLSSQGNKDGLGKLPVSNPSCMVIVEKGGQIQIIEEYLSREENYHYWTNSVMQLIIHDGGKVRHSYIQKQAKHAAHIKWTLVKQGESSDYELIEIGTGGKLSRHNLHIQQLGSDTVTNLSTFHLCGSQQVQDLHSRLILDHPRAQAQQIHKCIVSHSSGQGVFDGNIKVNRYAQKTDAGQLSRSLLLAPRATVNLKPNLQIIADDVKCSHGAAISDLEKDPLFYFQARGIDLQTARNAMIFSFGAEVTERLDPPLQKSINAHLRDLLTADRALQ